MRKLFALFIATALILSGCSGSDISPNKEAVSFKAKSEKVVKELSGSLNVYARINDMLMLTADKGDVFENYRVDLKKGEVVLIPDVNSDAQYLYNEMINESEYIFIEAKDDLNYLKLHKKDGTDKIITDSLSVSESLNISVSPKAGKVAYIAGGIDGGNYGLYIYDIISEKSLCLMQNIGKELIQGFSYMINWSPDEKYIILQDKYIYETASGSKKGELKSSYTSWSKSGKKIAFIYEDGSEKWLEATDFTLYPGKVVCIYNLETGDYQEVCKVADGENVFGDIAWSDDESKIAFTGVIIKDRNAPDWYTKLIYNTVYWVDVKSKKTDRLKTSIDSSEGELTELANLAFNRDGSLLTFTVGNFSKNDLYVLSLGSGQKKVYENAEYLHWMNGENYIISQGEKHIYLGSGNQIISLNDKLQENVVYTSKSKLEDFYFSEDGRGITLLETKGEGSIIRFLGM